MHPLFLRVYATLILTLATLGGLLGQAPEGESPYSSSTVDEPAGSNFLGDNVFVIVLAVVFLLLFIFLFVRGRRRA